jgi:hypothetical protein
MKKIMSRIIKTTIVLACYFSIFPAFAWNALGHEVIAEIAFANLSPAARETVRQLAIQFSLEYPAIDTFVKMAPWPDEIRSQKIEYFTHWHYIDQAISTDGLPEKNIVDTDNAVWAINLLEPVVQNPHANLSERARALAFLEHIAGDLHQPLHTVSRLSINYPDGDRGGNLYLIKNPADGALINLHRYWDSGAGIFSANLTADHVKKLAAAIMTAFPKKTFGSRAKDIDPAIWAAEGKQTATTFVYQTAEEQTPDTAYIANARKIAEQKTALAGYRLAELINHLIG